ncbi:DUF2167 domain-containing protein [Bacillus sp. NP157]|nr:DUF2167 domain-containing protein [Bacillus sp. NP157]
MSKFVHRFATLLALSLLAFVAHAEEIKDLPWQVGPTKVQVGTQASMDVPEGYAFLGPDGTRRLDKIMHNPSSDSDTYTLAPKALDWAAFFDYDDVGYVKDDEKLDADDLLKSVTEGTEESNKERLQNGWDPLSVTGWKTRPQYDATFKSLTWAFVLRNNKTQHESVNYNARLLGRSGVMSVVLVADPEDLTTAIGQFKSAIGGFAFNAGQAYTDFHTGDRVAEYGLGALIVGGAAAVAAKKGFFAVILSALAAGWKLVLVGLAAVGTFFKRIFSRKQG